MDEKQWLESRRGGIGGTDAAAILGLTPWVSPLDVWLDKTQSRTSNGNGATSEVDPDKAFLQEIGKRLEPVIQGLYEMQTGRTLVQPEPKFIRHKDYPMLVGTPDRYVKGRGRGVELKSETPYVDRFGDPGTDEVPDFYRVQCVHYMALTDYDAWDIALLHGGARFGVYPIERDYEEERELIEYLVEWWESYVVKATPPPVDGSDSWARYAAKRHSKNYLPLGRATDEQDALILELRECGNELAMMELSENTLKTLLKVAIGDRDGIRGDSGTVTWKRTKDSLERDFEKAFETLCLEQKITAFDRARIINLYTKPKPGHRRFLLTPPKAAKDAKKK